jgi:hypothetical protein
MGIQKEYEPIKKSVKGKVGFIIFLRLFIFSMKIFADINVFLRIEK